MRERCDFRAARVGVGPFDTARAVGPHTVDDARRERRPVEVFADQDQRRVGAVLLLKRRRGRSPVALVAVWYLLLKFTHLPSDFKQAVVSAHAPGPVPSVEEFLSARIREKTIDPTDHAPMRTMEEEGS